MQTITDPARNPVAADFILPFQSGWKDPLSGPRVPELMLTFFKGTQFVGAYGAGRGPDYVVSHPPSQGFRSQQVRPKKSPVSFAVSAFNRRVQESTPGGTPRRDIGDGKRRARLTIHGGNHPVPPQRMEDSPKPHDTPPRRGPPVDVDPTGIATGKPRIGSAANT